MAGKTVILPVCSDSAGGCSVDAPTGEDCSAKAEVDKKRKQVIFYLSNPPAVKPKGRITISQPGTEYNPYQCMEAEECLIIERPVYTYHPVSGEPTRMADHPVVKVGEPAHCHWQATVVTGRMTETESVFFARVEPDPGSACLIIEAGESYTPACEGFRNFSSLTVEDNSKLVPGMLVSALHHFQSGNRQRSYLCGQKYYRTCSMTGGVITAVNGTHDDVGVSYQVQTENRVIRAVSSDFVDYEVGDWVFLMSGADACDLSCDTNYDYNPEPGAEEEENSGSGSFTDFVKLLNAFRAENGKNPVTLNSRLDSAAQRHCQDMVTHNFFSHKGTDGTWVHDRVEDAGYASDEEEWGSGENVAMGFATAQAVFTGWKNSPGHRANMLDGNFKEIGLSRLVRGTTYYWVNVFGYRGTAEETPGTECPVTADFVILPLKIGGKGA
jgi:uncharacterized protein YkwD